MIVVFIACALRLVREGLVRFELLLSLATCE